jgi:hypothetical protein
MCVGQGVDKLAGEFVVGGDLGRSGLHSKGVNTSFHNIACKAGWGGQSGQLMLGSCSAHLADLHDVVAKPVHIEKGLGV